MLNYETLKALIFYDPESGIFTWKVNKGPFKKKGDSAGTIGNSDYICIMINRRKYQAHRLAWLYMTGVWPINDIDHRNQIRSDNRFSNLRELTRKENCQNVIYPHKDNACGLIGVNWDKKCKKYRSQIQVNGKKKHLGLFDTSNEASIAYQEAKKILHPFSNDR